METLKTAVLFPLRSEESVLSAFSESYPFEFYLTPYLESNELRSSTGVALDWSSPIGPISFIFATNLSKASTDKTESFNFNLGTSF